MKTFFVKPQKLGCALTPVCIIDLVAILTKLGMIIAIFLTQMISRQQKWNSRWQFSKNCIFPNIQLKGVVNRLPPFKNLSDHTNIFLMG